jgi:anaerobic magnesium-protoporphyrin IX monomethyl ester cyclase
MNNHVDIALVNPAPSKGVPSLKKEPLGLGFLAAFLEKKGIVVRIIDEISGADAGAELMECRPAFVGITAMTMFAPSAYRIADFVKKELRSVVVMGGVHPSALPDEALGHCDVVVVGEGEQALADIVASGNALLGARKIVAGTMIDTIDDIPMPSRHLMNMKFYLAQKDQISGAHLKTASLLTSRGCPFSCIFCHNSVRKIPVRFHSSRRVVSEIEELVVRYGIESLAITDECFTGNKSRVREICTMLIDKGLAGLKWECQAQAHTLDTQTLLLMKKAGCFQIALGIESGSQRILDVLEKGTSVEDNSRAIRLCRDNGVRVRGCFIIGTPSETEDDIRRTQRFIDDNPVDFVSIHFLTPYPGTKLWESCGQRHQSGATTDWGAFTTGNPAIVSCNTALSPPVQRQWFERLQARYVFKNYSPFVLFLQSIKKPGEVLRYAIRFLRLMLAIPKRS